MLGTPKKPCSKAGLLKQDLFRGSEDFGHLLVAHFVIEPQEDDFPQMLRQLLQSPDFILMPCCYDAFSARLIEQSEFSLTFMSGFAVRTRPFARSRRQSDGRARGCRMRAGR